MAKKALSFKPFQGDIFCEDVPYTPPKNELTIGHFNECMAYGSYSLPDSKTFEGNQEFNSVGTPKRFFQETENPPKEIVLNFSKHDHPDFDRYSVDSFKQGAQTVTTASNESTASYRGGALSKRSPKKTDWIFSQIPKTGEKIKESGEKGTEKEVFVNSVFGDDIASERICRLAIRIIDQNREDVVQDKEWLLLSETDRLTLATYLAQVFGQRLQTEPYLETPAIVNDMLEFKVKERRNEERLNKTVKTVNSLMVLRFASINGLDINDEEQLNMALQNAYMDESCKVDIFSAKTVFSQKSFSEALRNVKYAEDFEAILKKSYIAECLLERKHKVLKEIKSLRKSLQQGHALKAQTDHNKRAPWLLEDIVEGAKLCQDIIDRTNIT